MKTTPTDKQQRFIDEYVIDQNATQAYKRAGYKVKTDHAAAVASSRLLLNPLVRAAVDERLAVLAKATHMTALEAHQQIACIARSDIGDIIDFTGAQPKLKPANEIPASALRALKSVDVKQYVEGSGESAATVQVIKFTFCDKLAANIAILRSHGELKERLEITGAKSDDVRIRFIEFANSADRAAEPAAAT